MKFTTRLCRREETHIDQQYQVEIPRRPIHRQLNKGHQLQTSDALGAAASQLGPDAQAAAVELIKQGMAHGKSAVFSRVSSAFA